MTFCSPDALPLSHRRLVGAKATKLGSCEKHLSYCLDKNSYMCFSNMRNDINVMVNSDFFFCQTSLFSFLSFFFTPLLHLTSHFSLLFPLPSSLPTFFSVFPLPLSFFLPLPFFLFPLPSFHSLFFPFTSIFFPPFLFTIFK